MHTLKHTVNCPVDGFEALEVEFNIAATSAQVTFAQKQGAFGLFITDFPNWEEVAPQLGLVEIDPETGEPTATPLAKPMPLKEHIGELPVILTAWLATQGLGYAAGRDIAEMLGPNSKRR